MKYCTAAKTRIGLVATALLMIFTLVSGMPAEAKQMSLKSQLKNNGIGMKITRLDRTDGFLFGLSFTGPKGNTFVLAPGLGGMFLIESEGNEVIVQRDATGKFQIISADGDISYALCIAQTIISFLSDLTICQDTTCYFTSVIELVTNFVACSNTVVPVE